MTQSFLTKTFIPGRQDGSAGLTELSNLICSATAKARNPEGALSAKESCWPLVALSGSCQEWHHLSGLLAALSANTIPSVTSKLPHMCSCWLGSQFPSASYPALKFLRWSPEPKKSLLAIFFKHGGKIQQDTMITEHIIMGIWIYPGQAIPPKIKKQYKNSICGKNLDLHNQPARWEVWSL